MISRQRKKSIRSGQKMMVYIVVTALILFYGIFVFSVQQNSGQELLILLFFR